jgi:heme exporter protein A
MIELCGLVKRFGHVRAIRGIDLAIPTGSFTTLFGPNGAGKTTLMKILSTLTRPTSGTITVDGRDLFEEQEEIRGTIGVISHNSFLYGSLSARENLRFYASLYGIDRSGERCDDLLREVGLHQRRDDQVRTFSQGMKQRLSIARALLADPAIVLLDEPFNGLDQHAARMLSRILGELHDGKRTILLVTHNLSQGLEGADRVLILVKGRIAHDSPAGEIDPAAFEGIYFDAVEGNS